MMREAPTLSGYQVKQLLIQTATQVTSLQGKVSSSARVDALTAVTQAKTLVGALADQPSYVARAPAGVASPAASSGSGSAAGCGSVVSVLSGGSANGVFGPRPPSLPVLSFLFLVLPLVVWFGVRTQYMRKPRRQFERFAMRSHVRVRVNGKDIMGDTMTIGLGGLSFESGLTQKLSMGGEVSMVITGPDGSETVEVMGQIVWSTDRNSYGVQFKKAETSSLNQIRSWTLALDKV
jgi:hypothetical protein